MPQESRNGRTKIIVVMVLIAILAVITTVYLLIPNKVDHTQAHTSTAQSDVKRANQSTTALNLSDKSRGSASTESTPVATNWLQVGDDSSVTIPTHDLSNNHLYSVLVSSNASLWHPVTNVIGSGTSSSVQAAVDPKWHHVSYKVIDVSSGSKGLSPQMAWIPPGSFRMGSIRTEKGHNINEEPVTFVTISRGFWMSVCEITQEEYSSVMDSNPSMFKGDLNLPVESVSWAESEDYCRRLTKREQSEGRLPINFEYRLPTEAEWEYACRANSQTRFYYGDDLNYASLTQYAWFWVNTGPKPHFIGENPWHYDASCKTQVVGSRKPNRWGLYDMNGNVWEWCADWFKGHPGGSVIDPRGPTSGTLKVIRGGSWASGEVDCRSASRMGVVPNPGANFRVGVRVVLSQK